MGTLRAGQDHVRCAWRSCGRRRQAHLDALVSHELHTGTPVFSPTPIPKDAAARDPPGADAAGDFPDAASWWLAHATDTANALGSRGNRGSWRCRGCADCHRLRGAARLGATSCSPDRPASRRAGGRSPAPRTDPRSCAGRPQAQPLPCTGACSAVVSVMGGANSVVRIGVDSSICPSSRRRGETHWETICHASWKAGRMRTPPVGILLLVFIGQQRGTRAAMQGEGHHIGGGEGVLRQMGEKEFVDQARAGEAHAALVSVC